MSAHGIPRAVDSNCSLSRLVVANYLAFLSGSDAFCCYLNCDPDKEFSLYHRFGMTQRNFEGILIAANFRAINKCGEFKINSKEWTSFIASGHFAFMPPEMKLRCDKKRMELDAHVEGRPPGKDRTNTDRSSRGTYHAIRIGRVEEGVTATSFLKQKDKQGRLLNKAPYIKMMRSEQHRSARIVSPLIFAKIYKDDNLYNYIMDEKKQPSPHPVSKLD